jgi:hypothetical protein
VRGPDSIRHGARCAMPSGFTDLCWGDSMPSTIPWIMFEDWDSFELDSHFIGESLVYYQFSDGVGAPGVHWFSIASNPVEHDGKKYRCIFNGQGDDTLDGAVWADLYDMDNNGEMMEFETESRELMDQPLITPV